MAGRRTQAERIAETTARLLYSARRAFAEHGYAEASMDDLTAEVGLTRGALYHHFGGKVGLFEAVVRKMDAEIGDRIERVWSEIPDKGLALRAACREYLEIAMDPAVQRIMFVDAPSVLGSRFREIDQATSIQALGEALAALPARRLDGDPMAVPDHEATARILNAALIEMALWIAANPEPNEVAGRAQAAIDRLLDQLVGEADPTLHRLPRDLPEAP